MNKHGVFTRRWFTEADVKYFENGVLRTITNITRSMVKLKKKNCFACVFQRFCSYIQNSFLKCKFPHRYFPRILLIDSELPTLKNKFP